MSSTEPTTSVIAHHNRRLPLVLGSLLATLAMVLTGFLLGAVPAAHATTGASLSGHVYISDNGQLRAARPSDASVTLWAYDGMGDQPGEWGSTTLSNDNSGYWEFDSLDPDYTYVAQVNYLGTDPDYPQVTFQDHLSTTPYEAFGLAGGGYGAHAYAIPADTAVIADSTTIVPTAGISGSVQGAWAGNPAVQTTVQLLENFSSDNTGAQWSEVASTTTTASGNFNFSGLTPTRNYVVYAQSSPSGQWQAAYDGGATDVSSAPVLNAGATSIISVQNNWGAISGAVTYSGTHPLAGATVQALDPNTLAVDAQATTDSTGKYRIDPVEPGSYLLEFSHAGYASQYLGGTTWWNAATVPITARDNATGFNANLAAGGTVTGHVTLGGSTAVARTGFTVQLCGKEGDGNWACGPSIGRVTTGGSGSYTISDVPAGSYILQASNLGGGDFVTEYSGEVPLAASATPISVAATKTTSASTIDLPAGATLEGNVSWATSSPDLSGIVVTAQLQWPDGHTDTHTTLTDTNGNYEFDNLPAGNYAVAASGTSDAQQVVTQYWNHENDAARASTVHLTAGGVASDIDFSLGTARTISGTVTSGGGPVSGVPVYLLPAYYPGETPANAYFTTVPSAIESATTDSNGQFSFSNLAEGNYRVAVGSTDSTLGQYYNGAPGDANGSTVAEDIQLVGGDTSIAIPLTQSGTYVGFVWNTTTNSPIVGAAVSIDGARATTANNGQYTITGLTPGSHTETVSASGYATQTVQDLPALDPAGSVVQLTVPDVDLEASSTIVGVVDGASGSPVKGVAVDAYVKSPQGDYLPTGSTSVSDSSGNFTITDLPTGNIVLRFVPSVAGAMPQYLGGTTEIEQATPVTISNPGETDHATEYLGKFSTLTGSVKVGGAGVKVPFTLEPVNGRSSPTADDPTMNDQHVYTTSTTGAFTLPGVLAGSYVLTVNGSYAPGNARAYSTFTKILNLSENSTQNLAISLPKRVAVSGRIVDSEGRAPLSGVGVQAYRWSGFDWIMDPSAYAAQGLSGNSYTLYLDPNTQYKVVGWGATPNGYFANFIGGGVGVDDPRSQAFTVGTTALTNKNIVLGDQNGISVWIEGYSGEDSVQGLATVANLTTGWSTMLDFEAPLLGSAFPLPTLSDGNYEVTLQSAPASDLNGYIPSTTVDFTVTNGQLVPASVSGPAYTAGGQNDAAAGFLGTLQLPAPVLTGADQQPALVVGASAPSIDQGSLNVGDTATFYSGDWTETPGDMLHQQWLRNGVPIAGATQSSYVVAPGDAGQELSVRILLDLDCTPIGCGAPTPGHEVVVDETPALLVNAQTLPDPTTDGGIVGKLVVGTTVSATPGTWPTNGLSFTYQWVDVTASGNVVVGTGATHKLTTADAAAEQFSLSVTAHLDGYLPETVSYAASGPVTPAATITQKTAPTVGGTAASATSWTLLPGTYAQTGTATAYRWLVVDANGDPSAPPAVHANEPMPKSESVEGTTPERVQLQVTVTKPGYQPLVTTLLVQTGASSSYHDGPDIPSAITQVGVPIVASTAGLTTLPQPSNPADLNWTFAWYRVFGGGVPTLIAGATSATYTPTTADIGDQIVIEATAHVLGFSPILTQNMYTSSTVVPVQPFVVSTLTITGTPRFGRVLTASMAAWVPQPTTLTYQWYRTPDGTTLTKITGATKSTYAVTAADIGSQLVVKATGSKSGYSTVTATSAASDPIGTAGQISNVTHPTVSGTAAVGSTLTAVNGIWDVAGATYTYQWLVNGETIPGATGSTYSPTAEDAYEQIAVQVVAAKSGYATSAATESSNTPVIALGTIANTASPQITANGKAVTTTTIGAILGTTIGSWSASGFAVSYRWQYSLDHGTTWADWPASLNGTSTVNSGSAPISGTQFRVFITVSRAGYSNATAMSPTVTVI